VKATLVIRHTTTRNEKLSRTPAKWLKTREEMSLSTTEKEGYVSATPTVRRTREHRKDRTSKKKTNTKKKTAY
jgi:hypothetical protein